MHELHKRSELRPDPSKDSKDEGVCSKLNTSIALERITALCTAAVVFLSFVAIVKDFINK